MTTPSPDSPDQVSLGDINLWLDVQRADLQANTDIGDTARRLQTEALDLVGRGVGRLATEGATDARVSVFDVMGQIDRSGAFSRILEGRARADQKLAYQRASGMLINALVNPGNGFSTTVATEKRRRAFMAEIEQEAATRERLEAERPALIEEALKAAGQTPQIYLTSARGAVEFGPNQGSNSDRYEPWSMFRTFSGQHRMTNVVEAVAFTPARTSRLVQEEAGRSWGRMQYTNRTVYEQARINGEPAVDIHYVFDPAFNGDYKLPGYERSSASYRITVPQSIAERLRESGPAAFRGIMDQLILQRANNGRAAEFRENWTEAHGSARPPYNELGDHWQMTVFDAMDKPVEDIVTRLGERGDRAGIDNIYTLSKIPAGSDQAPPLLRVA